MNKAVTLSEMNNTTEEVTTPYATMIDDRYEKTFTSGHKLIISKFFGNHPYGVTFKAPNGKHGEVHNFDTAELALDAFNHFFTTGMIRKELINGFVY